MQQIDDAYTQMAEHDAEFAALLYQQKQVQLELNELDRLISLGDVTSLQKRDQLQF